MNKEIENDIDDNLIKCFASWYSIVASEIGDEIKMLANEQVIENFKDDMADRIDILLLVKEEK